jgi:hypothetical protein
MNISFPYKFAGFDNGEFSDSSLLGCDTVQSCTTSKFRSNMKFERGDSVFLQHVITHLQDNPVYHNLKCSPVRYFYLTIEISEAVYCQQNSNPYTEDVALVLGTFGKFRKDVLLHTFMSFIAVSKKI